MTINIERPIAEDILGSRARIKILKVLAKEGELNISLIISKTRLNHANVIKHLKFLKSCDLIQEKIFGRIKIYRLKVENKVPKYIKNLIKLIEGE